MELPKTDGKSIAAMLVSKAAVKDAVSDSIPGEPAEEEYSGKEACAEELMTALTSNDVKGFIAALEAFLDHRS